jgi:hypothetical protein
LGCTSREGESLAALVTEKDWEDLERLGPWASLRRCATAAEAEAAVAQVETDLLVVDRALVAEAAAREDGAAALACLGSLALALGQPGELVGYLAPRLGEAGFLEVEAAVALPRPGSGRAAAEVRSAATLGRLRRLLREVAEAYAVEGPARREEW